MMERRPARRGGGDAAALRFLLLLLAGWAVLRVAMLWNPAIPVVPRAIAPPWAPPPPFAAPARDEFAGAASLSPSPDPVSQPPSSARAGGHPPTAGHLEANPAAGFGAERHSLRLALIARLLPLRGAAAVPAGRPAWLGQPVHGQAPPARGEPFWMQRSLSGWSLGGWLYLREGSGKAPGGIAASGQLGGSQAGLRLAYGVGDGGRLRAYGRATTAIEHPDQRELAFGLTFAPSARLPVDVAIEQRIAAGREGRTALAAFVSGGVGDIALPAGFRLEAYAQAGIVGARRRDGFADGAVVVDHRLGKDERAPLRLGALAAGAVQPGAARVDVGPRLTLKLPDVGQGSRIALDWRQRIAGEAQPESGVALTLATDF